MLSESTHGTQVTQVGMEFKAGPEGNAEINRLQGMSSGEYGGRVLRESGPEWDESPDYCADAALCLDMLESHSITPFILPTYNLAPKRRKTEFVLEYVGVFEMRGTLYVTAPQLTEDNAAACVLWFALSAISHE